LYLFFLPFRFWQDTKLGQQQGNLVQLRHLEQVVQPKRNYPYLEAKLGSTTLVDLNFPRLRKTQTVS